MAHPLQLEYEPKKRLRGRLRAGLIKLFSTVTSKRFIVRFVGVAAILAALGYVSDRVSLARCERRTAFAIAKELGGRPFHAGSYHEAETRAIFAAAGIPALPSVDPRHRDRLPGAGIDHAHSVAPFIVEVEYGYGYFPVGGHGGIRRYFCLFGVVIQIEDQLTWIS